MPLIKIIRRLTAFKIKSESLAPLPGAVTIPDLAPAYPSSCQPHLFTSCHHAPGACPALLALSLSDASAGAAL